LGWVARNPGDPILAASLEGVNFPLSGLKVAWYIPSDPRPPVPKKISNGLARHKHGKMRMKRKCVNFVIDN
jgi:hypothetical protein